jgi:glutamine synthetase adenylyltransferase
MPQSAAIQEKLKRFEESNALNVNSTKAAANTIHSHQKSSTNAYLPIYSHQQQQQQTSANQDILFNDNRNADERQMVTKGGGFANENRVSKYLEEEKKNTNTQNPLIDSRKIESERRDDDKKCIKCFIRINFRAKKNKMNE